MMSSTSGFSDYFNVGEIHNLGLEYLIETNDLSSLNTNSELYQSFMRRIFEFLRGSDLYNVSECVEDSLQTSNYLSYALDNELYGNSEATFDFVINLLGSRVSTVDLAYINDARLLMSAAVAISVGERYNFISEGVLNLIAEYNNEDVHELQPTLILGFLHTLLYSNSFWDSRTDGDGNLMNFEIIDDPDNPSMPPVVLIPMLSPITVAQIDAAGYLYGWTQAWLVDQLPNPECRIAAGQRMAMQWSAVAIARAIFS